MRPRNFAISARSARRAAFTLLETVIALSLLLVTTLSFTGSLIYNNRTSVRAKSDVFALEVINRVSEELRSSNYDRIGTNQGDEARFLAPLIFQMDPDNPEMMTVFTANVTFSGFGTVAAANANSLRAAGNPGWETDQWAGRFVMVKEGAGRGQVAFIESNTADTLNISYNLDGTGGSGWIVQPTAGDYFEIDNGKSAEIVVTWQENGRPFEQRRNILIPSYLEIFN